MMKLNILDKIQRGMIGSDKKVEIEKDFQKLKINMSMIDVNSEFDIFVKEIMLNIPELYKIEKTIMDILIDIETEQDILDMFTKKFDEYKEFPTSKKRRLSQLNISNEISSEITTIDKNKIDNYFKKTNRDITFKNIKEIINNKDILPLQVNVYNTNNIITLNQTNDTDSLLVKPLSDNKSTNYSNNSLITVNTNKPPEVKINNFRGINSRLAGNIVNAPKTIQEKNKNKKNSKNIIKKLFESLDYNPVVNPLPTNTNNIKDIVNKNFYNKKPEREDEVKYSVRNKNKGDTSLLSKYSHSIFKKNHIYPKKDVSPARTDLSDEILVHKTPTRENQLTFVPDRINLLKIFNQNKK
jgi:hypothetical protein